MAGGSICFRNLDVVEVDIQKLEAFEMCVWRRMKRISWIEKVRNEEVLRRVEGG